MFFYFFLLLTYLMPVRSVRWIFGLLALLQVLFPSFLYHLFSFVGLLLWLVVLKLNAVPDLVCLLPEYPTARSGYEYGVARSSCMFELDCSFALSLLICRFCQYRCSRCTILGPGLELLRVVQSKEAMNV